MKKSLKLCLTGLCCIGFVAACSSNETDGNTTSNPDVEVNQEGFPIVDEEITLSLMAPGTGLAEWKDMPTLQEYSEMTNISFNYTTPPMSDFATRLNLSFASGDVADIIYGAGTGNLRRGWKLITGGRAS